MAKKILGQLSVPEKTSTIVYTVPTGKSVICNINVVNKEVYDVNVSISLSASSTPTDAEYIEYNKLVARNGGTIEKRGIALEAGRKIIVYASATGISINVYGYEE